MKLENKKALAAKTLGVGKNKIIFNTTRLADIKEAITKQDIRDLFADGAILIRQAVGRRAVVRRKIRRKAGSIKNPNKSGKEEYMIITRKLRAYIAELRRKEKISDELFHKIRKEIRARNFKSKLQLKERLNLKWKP